MCVYEMFGCHSQRTCIQCMAWRLSNPSEFACRYHTSPGIERATCALGPYHCGFRLDIQLQEIGPFHGIQPNETNLQNRLIHARIAFILFIFLLLMIVNYYMAMNERHFFRSNSRTKRDAVARIERHGPLFVLHIIAENDIGGDGRWRRIRTIRNWL